MEIKDNYIIINKTSIQKRIEELKNILPDFQRNQLAGTLACDALIKTLEEILSKSTPLIPEIEQSLQKGEELSRLFGSNKLKEKQDYISNLKLNV